MFHNRLELMELIFLITLERPIISQGATIISLSSFHLSTSDQGTLKNVIKGEAITLLVLL